MCRLLVFVTTGGILGPFIETGLVTINLYRKNR